MTSFDFQSNNNPIELSRRQNTRLQKHLEIPYKVCMEHVTNNRIYLLYYKTVVFLSAVYTSKIYNVKEYFVWG